MIIKSRLSTAAVCCLIGSIAIADEVQLESIDVVEETQQEKEAVIAYETSYDTETLAENASGETLGDYLSGELGVESASYGPAVGRPTVRGMEGYRVGIAQGGIMLNDLSAMSQDHAVGLNAKMAERIEMAKGPASLLYGSYSGGVIRTLGEEHESELYKKGLTFDGSLSTNSDTNKGTLSTKAAYATDRYEVYLNYYKHEADSYHSGGDLVEDSDTSSEQLHGVLGWAVSLNTLIKLYGDTMDKAYGIPNRTEERTDILMEQNRYGVVVHNKTMGSLRNVMTEYQLSDYRHYEREDGRYDGLFDQQQQSLSSSFDFTVDEMTDADFRLELLQNELKVCHEHGQCDRFTVALRTDAEDGLSLLNYYNDTGIAYSHGHPMPDTEEKKVLMALNVKRYYEADELSLASNMVVRKLTSDSANVQETWLMHESVDDDYYRDETRAAFSLSLGWWHSWSEYFSTQTSLSYLERLPSAQELYWNGFHHATESYILGNRDLDKEKSVNLDIDALFKHSEALSSKVSLYYYDFANYIYQAPMADSNGTPMHDPFHGSPVWEMKGVGATIYGFGIEEHYQREIAEHLFGATLQFNFLKGELDKGGYIPRMAPYNVTLTLNHAYGGFQNEISYKWVDESRNEADNETHTEGYQMLNLSTRYHYDLSYGSLELWLKAQNLTDDIAKNHISFLKESAPLPGRAVIAGIRYQY
ncbi:MAG: TonB-dependent receptor plug domain-containing protein [Sulfurimonas sp.]